MEKVLILTEPLCSSKYMLRNSVFLCVFVAVAKRINFLQSFSKRDLFAKVLITSPVSADRISTGFVTAGFNVF